MDGILFGRINNNDYEEYESGRFDSSLVCDGEEVARTYGDIIRGFNKIHEEAIKAWAKWYELPIEWV